MTIFRHAYALAGGSTLVSFNPATPSVGTSIPVTGLVAGQTLVGIDVRPTTGLLYGLGVNAATDTATLYTISVLTGVSTIVGSFGGVGDLPPSGYGFDFNAAALDRIRVTTGTGLNFRINPDTGAIAGLDVAIAGQITGAAYTNDEAGSTVSTLYSLDSSSDQLKIANGPGGPNGGTHNPVGSVGVNFSDANGFDIPPGIDASAANTAVSSGTGLALLTVGVSGTIQLYTINLVTGAGTLVGNFVGGTPAIGGLAILNPPSGDDFNGYSGSDILWRNDSGQVYFWNMNGTAIDSEGGAAHAVVPTDWHIQGTGDFDADGRSDILWRHDSGQTYIWEMNGLNVKAEGTIAHAAVGTDWQIQGTGDFDADGRSDIVWRHDSGQVYFWEMNGLGIKAEGGVAHAAVGNDWHIQRIADFDGDAISDILWRHDSGQVYIWEMNDLGIKAEGGVAHAAVGTDWQILGTGDFDGDGKSDILWRHDSGQVYIWEMDGLGVKAEGGVAHAAVGNDWHIERIADFDNDNKSDILWRHDSGQVYIWEMNGLSVKAEGTVMHAAVSSDWHIFSG
jgi:hypothetical protein